MNIDQVIQTCRAIALQHYPDDEAARYKYQVTLLETKLREVAHRKAGLYPECSTSFKFETQWHPV